MKELLAISARFAFSIPSARRKAGKEARAGGERSRADVTAEGPELMVSLRFGRDPSAEGESWHRYPLGARGKPVQLASSDLANRF